MVLGIISKEKKAHNGTGTANTIHDLASMAKRDMRLKCEKSSCVTNFVASIVLFT